MGSEIEVVQWSVNDLEVMAERVAKSKLFGLDPAQAFTLMLLAQSEGIHPIKAVQRYNVLFGKPSMKADAMHADFLRIGGIVKWVTESDDREKAEAIFRHPTFEPEGKSVRFSMKDAKDAGLIAKNDLWQKYPSNMLRARVISNGVRMIAPGIVAGLYTPEEVQDIADDERKAHHAVNHNNDTGHGSGAYAEPSVVSDYQQWVSVTCEDVNSKWLDTITDKQGEINSKAPGSVVDTWQLSGHLLKWGRSKGWINAPDDVRPGQRDKFAAVLMLEHADDLQEEARLYCRKLWKEAKAKTKPRTEPTEDEILDKIAATEQGKLL